MIRNEYLMHIEATYGGLAQPIVGTPYTVIKATRTAGGPEMQIKSRISDHSASVSISVQTPCLISKLRDRFAFNFTCQ
jgi:hypothetical protein